MNKHTPGPWVVYTNPVTGSHVIGQTDGPPIVKLKAGQVSNAHLIAAAPAMYEALRNAAEWLNDMSCEHGTEQDDGMSKDCVVCQVNAALAQAEGRDK